MGHHRQLCRVRSLAPHCHCHLCRPEQPHHRRAPSRLPAPLRRAPGRYRRNAHNRRGRRNHRLAAGAHRQPGGADSGSLARRWRNDNSTLAATTYPRFKVQSSKFQVLSSLVKKPLNPEPGTRNPLREVALLSLKLGLTAFGGPAAHIAMLRDEVVTRRKWLTDDDFLDLLGATNLIPGPNSTEMVMHVGRVRAGWRGLVVAGSLFILPAALIVLTLAWLYVAYGTTPTAEWLLYGIKPVIIAVVVQALWGLAKTAVKSALLAVVGLATFTLY